jgi:hypothetical protein
MIWIKNLINGKKESQALSNTEIPSKVKDDFTLGDLKAWCKNELPALGFSKLKLMISKKLKNDFHFSLDECPDDTIIPEDVLKFIDESVYELFYKRIIK